jgi:hypothetical protein
MSSWTEEDLYRIGDTEELGVATTAPDGTVGPFTTIWVVRVGERLYVRSFRGRGGVWYRHVTETGRGRIRAGGVEWDVTFEPAEPAEQRAVNEAYKSKYVVYADRIVAPMLAPEAVEATLRLTPA